MRDASMLIVGHQLFEDAETSDKVFQSANDASIRCDRIIILCCWLLGVLTGSKQEFWFGTWRVRAWAPLFKQEVEWAMGQPWRFYPKIEMEHNYQ